MSYVERKINVEFQLGTGKFGEELGDTVSLSGLRCEAVIENAGGILLSNLHMRIYGMKESDMNQLNAIGLIDPKIKRNVVIVTAGDDVTGMSQVFKGTIITAYADYNAAPNVPLYVEASSNYFERIKPAAANSYRGSTDVATIIEAIAKSIGFTFKNNGVTTRLSNQYLCGTAINQIKDCAEAAAIGCAIENGSVEIWPNGSVRDDVEIDVSPSQGLVGYPYFTPLGITFKCLFNPDIIKGRKVNVLSTMAQASGMFYSQTIIHDISSKLPMGPWFTSVEASRTPIYGK
ncbi:TPA: hypothetical protein ACGFAU_004522 [Yersinia enterocolitica]|uniref:baseplate hub protein n=1 Tax=Yersinia massiliensis TaxID=419257 RepID=UPI001CFEC270|nr:hypothetical protein [Yersinia massiliensis]MCB5318614.1 hypothetical protein [Yersinia massiliensis]